MFRKNNVITVALLAAVFCMFASRPAAAKNRAPINKLMFLENNIRALNLINGLYLTREQSGEILDILYELKAVNEEYEELSAAVLGDLEAAYEKLQADLMDDDMVDENVEKNAAEKKAEAERLETDRMRRLSELNEKLDGVFDEKQEEIIKDYKPCIIPPKNVNNTRIGQTEGLGNPRVMEMIRKMRRLPPAQFEEALSRTIAGIIHRLEIKNGEYSLVERDAEISRLTDLARDVYRMSDVEFEMKKSEIAEEMKPRLPYEAAAFEKKKKERGERKDKEKEKPEGKYGLNKTGGIFLNENLIEIFEAKLEVSGE